MVIRGTPGQLESESPECTDTIDRVIGRLRADAPGPTVVAIGGIHGNEPAGRIALGNVMESLQAAGGLSCGDFVALVGNVEASCRGVRYVDVDLNRCWESHPRFGAASEAPERSSNEGCVEDGEYRELSGLLDDSFRAARGETVLLDLHSTSAPGQPFSVFADTLRIREFIQRLPLPVILGLEEQLEGTMSDFAARQGHLAFAVEGGQHDAQDSVTHLETVILVVLLELGVVTAERLSVPVREKLDSLRALGASLPGALEVRYRHAIRPEDAFQMRAGFRSFQPVAKGEVLGADREGPVKSPSNGYLLMPLYQTQGDDGFFLIRGVRPFWLFLSSCLRRMRFGRIVHWVPGVKRDAGSSERVIVDTAVARWYALEILHLLGFRRLRASGSRIWFERRAHDLERARGPVGVAHEG